MAPPQETNKALAEILTCAHFRVSTGLCPSIQKLDKETNEETLDWEDPPVPGSEQRAPSKGPAVAHPGLKEEPEVQSAILRLWRLFTKGPGNAVRREEYEGFIRRLIKVVLPGLDVEQEATLAASTWEEGAGSADQMSFAQFYIAIVRIAKMWTNSREKEVLADFLDDILMRITTAKITNMETGDEQDIPPDIVVRFWSQNGAGDFMPPECEFATSVVIEWRGKAPKFQLEANVGQKSFVTGGANFLFYKESARDPYAGASPSDSVSREWAPLDSIAPIGRAVLVALQAAEAATKEGPLSVDLSSLDVMPDSPVEGARQIWARMLPSDDGSLTVSVAPDEGALAIVEGTGEVFGITELLGVGLTEGNSSNSIIVTPAQSSVLYLLDLVRRGLALKQPRAALAALPTAGVSLDKPTSLPSFTNVLKNEVELDAEGMVKPVHVESLLESGSLGSLGELFVNTQLDEAGGGFSSLSLVEEAPRSARGRPGGTFSGQKHLNGFLIPKEGLGNDIEDLLTLAGTSPVALWIFGQADTSGEYKTQVCRYLADNLGLEWLQPSYLLGLAVKTPPKHRTPLMSNCVEQLQRGMAVSTSQALFLALEMMSSAKCKTNGYVLDFPPLCPSDAEAVSSFAKVVADLSGASTIQWDGLKRYLVQLPPLSPEPEPPKPPPAEGEGEGGADGEKGEGEAGEEGAAGGEEEEEKVEAGAEDGGEAGQPQDGDAAAAEDEVAAEDSLPEAKPEELPYVPNFLANVMPRRLVLLSMEQDELKAWRLAMLKEKHAEKEREKKRREAAEEDEPPEDDVEEEQPPALPEAQEGEENEEVAAMFEKTANDILATMRDFVRPPALELPANKCPPLPDESQAIAEEPDDQAVLKACEDSAVKGLRDMHQLPLLRLHADGRPPKTTAELLNLVTGCFSGGGLSLPNKLEGAGDEPKELLRLAPLKEQQASRRWSPWMLHCPVSLQKSLLLPGNKDFAVEYAGYVFTLLGAAEQNIFCSNPKKYLAQEPAINLPGMHQGYVILSPCGYRCTELATAMQSVYGFDVVDVPQLILKAMDLDTLDEEVPAEGAEGEEVAAQAKVEEPPTGIPRLFKAEMDNLLEGKKLGTETIVRIIGTALKIERNITAIKQHQEELAAIEKRKEEAAEAGGEELPEVVVPPPVTRPPERGFVLAGFPESEEEMKALKEQLALEVEQVLVLKSLKDDGDLTSILKEQQQSEVMPLGESLDQQMERFESLKNIENARIEELEIDATIDAQVVDLRKKIDPFYTVVLDPSIAMDIPDPDEWDPVAAAEAAGEGEEGEVVEPPQKPVIPWGAFGPYCPVTLKEDLWLFPGQKDFFRVVGNRVYALADEKAKDSFEAEPARYMKVKVEPSLPPPRILITGPAGSTVARQCEMLSKVYHIPVLKLEEVWRDEVARRIAEVRAIKKKALDDEKEPPPEDDAEEAEPPAEPTDEELGLDDLENFLKPLFVEAMRTVLGPRVGACVIDGAFFGDLSNEEMGADVKEERSLQNLLVQARRLPDIVTILTCKNQLAFTNVHDPALIDKEDEELLEVAKSQNAANLKAKLESVQYITEERKTSYKDYLTELEGDPEEGPPESPPDVPDSLLEPEEKESAQVRKKFVDMKAQEQEALTAFREAVSKARCPLQKISVDRGEEPSHKAIRWHCRQFVEQRASLLLRHQASKVLPTKGSDLMSRGLALKSRFKDSSPMTLDHPVFPGQKDACAYVAELRNRLYYPHSEEELQNFLQHPQDFASLPPPSRIAVRPAIAICGPPLSGKTMLARMLAERTGAVYLGVPEVIGELCNPIGMPSSLSREVAQCIRNGRPVEHRSIVEALRRRLTSPEVLRCGWVLDDFPLTISQAKALEEAGIVPHRLLIVNIPECLVFERASTLCLEAAEADDDLSQKEPALQRERLNAYNEQSPLVRAFYGLTYDNVRDVDGARSAWAVYDQALKETTLSVSQRLEYYRRTAQQKAARVHGMCFPPIRVLGNESVWRQYCPVALTLGNELVPCRDTRFTVEYKSKIYWVSCEEHTRLFCEDPDSFLQVNLPEAVPQLLTATERRTTVPCQLEDYCAVTLVDKKELVKATGHHIVRFMAKAYSFQSKEAAAKFMRRPFRYVQRAKLPNKRPALKGEHQVSLMGSLAKGRDGRGLEPADMLTFMQASVAELICQALVDSGEKRPLLPGKTPRESALLFLTKFLRAKNPLNTEMFAGNVRTQFEEFLSDCALPQQLGEVTLDKETCESEGSWRCGDERMYKEMCERFDRVFDLPA